MNGISEIADERSKTVLMHDASLFRLVLDPDLQGFSISNRHQVAWIQRLVVLVYR